MASEVLRFFCRISVFAAVAGHADISDRTCPSSIAKEVMQGSALLQVKRTPAPEIRTLSMVSEGVKYQATRTCSGAADPYTAPLDASGFLTVTSTCCAWKMEAFFIRLLESMGYRICSKPHLQGLVHWFNCVPAMDFDYVLTVISNGNEHGCKYWAKTGETCMAIVGTKCDNPCIGGADPATASLNAAGFLSVTSTCCAWKMEMFFIRLLELMGYRICSKPHVQGLMHWFTCVPSMDFNYVLTIIANGNEHGCKYWAKTGETCPAIVGTKCDNPCKPEASTTSIMLTTTKAPAKTTTLALTTTTTTRRRTTTTSTTITTATTTTALNVTCCRDRQVRLSGATKWTVPQMTVDARAVYARARASSFIALEGARLHALSSVEPWDCSFDDGPVQVITDFATGPFTNVSQLNVLTGEYELLFQIPTNVTQPEMEKFINSAAINPVDGIAYATVPIGDDNYMVRFDEDTFEFVAKLPDTGDITGNYAKNKYFVGAFGWDGTYYIGAEGKLLAIQEVALMQGFDSQTNSGLTRVTNQTASVFDFPGFYADVIIGMGDFDSSGTESQWIFGLSGNSMLTLGKVPSDVGAATEIEYFQLQATNALSNPGGSAASFGAAWNYQDVIFFARNNGDGIFEVQADTIDLNLLTYSLQLSGSSSPTNKNDGLGCMESENPWFCNDWEETFYELGKCPDGARPVAGLPSA